MGKFSRWLKHFAKISKLEDFWRYKGEQASLRGLYMGIAANLSVLIGIIVKVLTGSYIYALLAATGSLPVFFSLAILIASKQWKRRMRNVVSDDDDFNWRMFLEDEYEEQIRKINDLALVRREASKLKVEAYREHQEILRLFQAKIAERPRQLPPESVNELQNILHEIESELRYKDPQKLKELQSRLEDIERRSRYLSS
jgi:hypothetical protein